MGSTSHATYKGGWQAAIDCRQYEAGAFDAANSRPHTQKGYLSKFSQNSLKILKLSLQVWAIMSGHQILIGWGSSTLLGSKPKIFYLPAGKRVLGWSELVKSLSVHSWQATARVNFDVVVCFGVILIEADVSFKPIGNYRVYTFPSKKRDCPVYCITCVCTVQLWNE